MFLKEPIRREMFVGRYTKFRRTVKDYGGCEVFIREIKKNDKPVFGDVRDYSGIGDVRIVEEDDVKKVPCTFNLGWVLVPK